MTVLSRRSFGSIDLLRISSDPVGITAPSGSLALNVSSRAVYKNIDGVTQWQLVVPNNPQISIGSVGVSPVAFTFGNGSNNNLLTADGSGGIVTESNLNFDGTNLSVAGGVSVTGGILDANSGLTANDVKIDGDVAQRLYIVGSSGEIKDESKLVFDGSTLAVDGGLAVTGSILPDADNTRNLGSSTRRYDTGNIRVIDAGGSALGLVSSVEGSGVLVTAGAGSVCRIAEGLRVGASYVSTTAPTGGAIFAGNIGAGTSSPSGRLHVSGSSTGTTPTLIVQHGIAAGSNLPVLDVRDATGSTLLLVSGSGRLEVRSNSTRNTTEGLFLADPSGAHGLRITQEPIDGSATAITTCRFKPVGNIARISIESPITLSMNGNVGIQSGPDGQYDIASTSTRMRDVYPRRVLIRNHSGYAGSEETTSTGGAQTTDATTATLFTSPTLLDNSATWVEVHIAARDTGGTDRGMAVRRALITRASAGSAALVGSVSDEHSNMPAAWGGGVALTQATIDCSGNTFRVRVQGAASTTINWVCTVRHQSVSST